MARLTVDLAGQSVKLPKQLQDQEPTHVSRYWIIARILNSIAAPKAKILDVGGKEGLLRTFGFSPTVIDMEQSKEPNFVLGNALDMPFSDKEFEVSVSCDVLEHIETRDREQFISEMVRVSKTAIICAPFSNPGVSEAEIEINGYYKALLKTGHRWLQEHIDNGLPSEEETAVTIKKLGYNYVKVRHFSLDLWPKVLKAHLLHAAFGDVKAIPVLTKELYKHYYDELCAYDFSNQGYRTFFIISKQDLSLKLPSIKTITTRKKKFVDDMIGMLFTAIREQPPALRHSMQVASDLQKTLSQTNKELEQARNELNQIKISRSWQVAQKLSRIKNFGK